MPAREPIRLQKYLSRAGVSSRRKAEELMQQRRIKVDGEICRELGTKVIPGVTQVEVDGVAVPWEAERVYILLNKPAGYITSLDDPEQRPKVVDLLPEEGPRVFPVGRLDWDSEGVLLLTNDGDLAHALSHPSTQVPRVYRVKVKGEMRADSPAFQGLRKGVLLEDGMASADRLRLESLTGRHTWLEMEIHVGRNRLIRRLCEAVGHPVLKLERIRFGTLTAEGLKLAESRPLRPREIQELRRLVAGEPVHIDRPPPSPRPASPARVEANKQREREARSAEREDWQQRGPGRDARGPGRDARGPSGEARGPGRDARGPGRDARGPGRDARGPGRDARGPGRDARGPCGEARGPGRDARGPGRDARGPGRDARGPGGDARGPGRDARGPGRDARGPGRDARGPGGDARGPGGDARGSGREARGPGRDARGPGRPGRPTSPSSK
ncbi:MAG: pseudouridine synthase, partial [Myxococcota bacterium]|nr:pseudouridine synthase [Myxococcota bacterium]